MHVAVAVLINPVGKSVLICSERVGDSVGMSDGEKVELNGLGLGASVGVSDGEKVGLNVGASVGMSDGEKVEFNVGASVLICSD